MYFVKGFIFVNSQKLAITRKMLVEDYGQARQLLSALGARNYLITLVKEDN